MVLLFYIFRSYEVVIRKVQQNSGSVNQTVLAGDLLPYNMTASGSPYVTAEFMGNTLTGKNLTVGDGKFYNGYYNAPLEAGTTYTVFARTVTNAQNGVSLSSSKSCKRT